MRFRFKGAIALLVLAGLPLAAALYGVRDPRPIELRMGPGDGPYVRGFRAEYEIYDEDTVHWSGLDATVELPLALRGPVTLAYRFSRPAAEVGRARASVAGAVVDTFETGKTHEERRAPVSSAADIPLVARFQVETAEPRGLGLRLDWVRFEGGPGSHARLRGAALFRAAALVLLLVIVFRIAGWTAAQTALLAAPWSLAATWGLVRDPWFVHRLLTELPEWTLVAGLGGVLVGRWLLHRGTIDAQSLRGATALAVTAFVARAALLNHPDYYYPDLRSHVKLALVVRQAGFDILRDPAAYIVKHGVWSRVIDGRTFAFPYSVAFHSFFALTSLPYDGLITAVKLGATLATVVPILAAWSLARRFGATALGPALMLLAPAYVHHLGLAYLAALFGHAMEMVFLAWLARHFETLARPRVFAATVALVATCQLSYVAAMIVIPIVLALLAAFVFLDGSRPDRRRLALLVLAAGVAGSLLAVLLYYRGFSALFLHALTRTASDAPLVASGDAARQNFFAVLWVFTRRYFDYAWAPAGLVGFFLLLRRRVDRPFLLAWGLTYMALLFGRATLPFVFQHPHEGLFATPLACLAAGQSVASLYRDRGMRRALGIALFVALAVSGLHQQWSEWSRHLARAL